MSADLLIELVVQGDSPSKALDALLEYDRHAADDLELFIQNDGKLYKSLHGEFAGNLITKVAKGQYDKNKAVKLMLVLADRGAQLYTREFDTSRGGTSFGIFDKPTRTAVAKALLDDFEEEAKSGRYEALLPKKYQGKLQYPLRKL